MLENKVQIKDQSEFEFDEIERKIVNEIFMFSNENLPFEKQKWSRGIKERLCILGKEYSYEVCARDCDNTNYGEWLYDMIWSKNEGDFLIESGLTFESEWNGWELDSDFQKLLQSRTDHRAWLFKFKGTSDDFHNTIKKCVKQVQVFKGTSKGDRYLFLGWNEDQLKFYKWLHVE